MIFNSYEYLLFLPIVAIVYFTLPWVKGRVVWLLMASYFFYMVWNPIFILLIIASTVVDYFAGRAIGAAQNEQRKKLFLWMSLLMNLGILFYFKYYNFLKDNVQFLFDQLNLDLEIVGHSWILPVGISFYTFQTLSYTIDIYRGKQQVEHNFFVFALYVSFFPQLVAGPIERSTNLLPQFLEKHTFDYQRVRSGLLMILIGLFKKIVIADRFAIYSDQVFENPAAYTGLSTILGTVFFTFQIYCDFSGYTDIAIGSARVLGYRLMENFKGPYFSKSIKEFWRRWHISLSTWFRDYLYIPLGGNRLGTTKLYRNLIIVFLITGLWHGANWTYVIWGIFHGMFLIVERLGGDRILAKAPTLLQVLYTFVVAAIGWVFFRAGTVSDALLILQNAFVFDQSFFNINIYASTIDLDAVTNWMEVKISLALLPIIILLHYYEYKIDIVESILSKALFVRWTIYILLIFSIPLLGQYGVYKPFIYFQF